MSEIDQPRPSRRLLVLVAVAALLAGAVAAASAVFLLGWRPPQERQYVVSAVLEKDVTAQQKDAVEQALGGIRSAGTVRFLSRADTYARLREALKSNPELLDKITEAAAFESYEVTFRDAEFTCDGVTTIGKLPGVDRLNVTRKPTAKEPGATVAC